MSQVIAERKINGGKSTIVQKICPSCKHAFWSGVNDHRGECVDCDPPIRPTDNRGLGRGLDRKVSEQQYHGAGYN